MSTRSGASPSEETVADAMVTRPATHPVSTTVGELRTLFDDQHVHMALLVDGSRLVGTIERTDLDGRLDDRTAARTVAALDGRTIAADVDLPAAMTRMQLGGRRRLAVTADDAELLGLLCLKANGLGFCSNRDVLARRQDRHSLRSGLRAGVFAPHTQR